MNQGTSCNMNNGWSQHDISGCLADEMIAQWVRGLASADEQALIQAHLEKCPVCRELVDTALAVEHPSPDESPHQAPEALTARARQLVGRTWETRIADIVLKITGGIYSAVETTGKVLYAPWLPLAEPLRGEGAAMPSVVVVETIYKHLRCRIETSCVRGGHHAIHASFKDLGNDAPVNRIAVILFLNEEEIESQTSSKGMVHFEDLLPGAYRLELILPDGLKGQLNFHLLPS